LADIAGKTTGKTTRCNQTLKETGYKKEEN
jgi:hypothetical protein